jgi:hypothetical protein
MQRLKHMISRAHLVLLLLLPAFGSLGQSVSFDSPEDMAKHAEKLFKNEEYVKAMPYFSQLLALDQSSPDYHFKFGACALYGETDLDKVIMHLQFAAGKAGTDPEVNYYLGRAYHLNFQFNEAIASYTKYASKGESKEVAARQVQRNVEMCNNGKRLLKNITDLVVLEKKEMREAEFFRLYDLSDIGGRIIVKPAELDQPYDKKKKERGLIHFPASSNTIYFSSYGKDGKRGKDIYQVRRLPDNTWGKAQILSGSVNTEFDEDYPFMHPDGKTLFFCSKGHNSMGGYDVFKSTYDEANNTFGPPENLDFAINTPDDDLMYIVDSLNNMAYFASGRGTVDGQLNVYKVKVKRIPVLITIIKGQFMNEIDGGNLAASITVEDAVTKEIVGIYNTDAKTGNYLITLPRSGRYRFLVEAQNSAITHGGEVEVPYIEEVRALKQELLLTEVAGEEELAIRNLFDENIEFNSFQFFRDKSNLEVNYSDEVAELLNREAKENEDYETSAAEAAGYSSNMTDQDIIKLAFEDATEQQQEAESLEENMEVAYFVANKKNEQGRTSAAQASQLLSDLDGVDDLQKQENILEAKRLKEESKRLANEAVIAYNLAQSLEGRFVKKQAEAGVALTFAKNIEQAINSNSREEAIVMLVKERSRIDRVSRVDIDDNDAYDIAAAGATAKEEEARSAMDFAQEYSADMDDLRRSFRGKQHTHDNTRKKDVKEMLARELEVLKEDIAIMQEDVEITFKHAYELQREAEDGRAQADLLYSVMNNEVTDAIALDANAKSALESQIASVGALSDAIQIDESQLTAANAANDTTNNTTSNTEPEYDFELDDFTAEHNAAMEELGASAGSQDDIDQATLRLNEELIANTEEQIESLQETLEGTVDEGTQAQITEDIQTLQAMQTEKEESNTALAESIAANTTVTPTNPNAVDFQEFNTNYDARVAELNENGVASSDELVELNNDVIEEIDNTLTDLAEAYENEENSGIREEIANDIQRLEQAKAEKEINNAELLAGTSELEEPTSYDFTALNSTQ